MSLTRLVHQPREAVGVEVRQLNLQVVVFLLTGKAATDDFNALLPTWKELLQPCTDAVPENRPDASTVRDQLARITC